MHLSSGVCSRMAPAWRLHVCVKKKLGSGVDRGDPSVCFCLLRARSTVFLTCVRHEPAAMGTSFQTSSPSGVNDLRATRIVRKRSRDHFKHSAVLSPVAWGFEAIARSLH